MRKPQGFQKLFHTRCTTLETVHPAGSKLSPLAPLPKQERGWGKGVLGKLYIACFITKFRNARILTSPPLFDVGLLIQSEMTLFKGWQYISFILHLLTAA